MRPKANLRKLAGCAVPVIAEQVTLCTCIVRRDAGFFIEQDTRPILTHFFSHTKRVKPALYTPTVSGVLDICVERPVITLPPVCPQIHICINPAVHVIS